MPALENARWELFAQELAKGEPATKAFVSAGFKAHSGNASRLRGIECVRQRVCEIQQAGAASAKVSIESLLVELEHARQRADSLNQLSASVKAISEKAKVSGLLVQKIEVSEPDFDDQTATEDILQCVAAEKGEAYAVLLAMVFDREDALAEGLLARHKPVIPKKLEYIRGLLAKPVASTPLATTPPRLGFSQFASEERKPRRNGR